MNAPLFVSCVLAAGLFGALGVAWFLSAPPTPPTNQDLAPNSEIAELRSQLASLVHRIDALEHAPAATSERSSAFAPAPRSVTSEPQDAQWYLEQYAQSFADDAMGSEYFRLAVEAYVVELVSPIAALVREGSRPAALRIALAKMLGKRRFDDSTEVIEALLACIRPPAPEGLALGALAALSSIGSMRALPGLEAAVPALRETAVRERALALLVELAGEAANEALLRLFLRAPDDEMRQMLVRLLGSSETVAALELLRTASGTEQPVRLEAARKIGDFDEPGFDALVAQWLQVETDAQVIAALGGVHQTKEAPGWSARKATGAPDADPRRDDQNAWAPKNPEMGLQWLQLTYASPMRANGVRVFEVNATGAVAEVRARAADGSWVALWRGTADGGGQPLLIQFPLTSFPVQTIRLVLDTNRKAGWNEIDAVELVSPGGAAWASRASASSTYASGNAPVGAERVFLGGLRTKR